MESNTAYSICQRLAFDACVCTAREYLATVTRQNPRENRAVEATHVRLVTSNRKSHIPVIGRVISRMGSCICFSLVLVIYVGSPSLPVSGCWVVRSVRSPAHQIVRPIELLCGNGIALQSLLICFFLCRGTVVMRLDYAFISNRMIGWVCVVLLGYCCGIIIPSHIVPACTSPLDHKSS